MFVYFYKKDEEKFNNPIMILEPTICTYRFKEKEFYAELPIDEEGRWKTITTDVIAKANNQLYRISEVNVDLDTIEVYGKPIFFDLADKLIIDKRPTLKNGQEALNDILEGTVFKGHSDISKINTAYYIRKNIVEALLSNDENSFLNRWGGEVLLDNFDVYINDRIGSDNGYRVDLGYNLSSIERTIDTSEVVTRIVPEGYDGITLDGIEPWVDSPLIKKYPHPKMKVVKFDDIKVKGEQVNDEDAFDTLTEAQQEMVKRCKELFEVGKVDEPKVNYKIDMVDLGTTTEYEEYKGLLKLNIGDTVHCHVSDLDINVSARVVNYEKDLITGDYTRLELGNYKQDYFEKQSDLNNTLDKITNANGTVNAGMVNGVINALDTKFKAMRDLSQKQDVRAILFEDRVPGSKTFGCMCLGSMGFEIADSFKPGTDGEWDYRTFGTGRGFTADEIYTGVLRSLDGKMSIDLTDSEEGVQFRKGTNNLKAIDIKGSDMKFYDWDGQGGEIGNIFVARDSETKIPALYIANANDGKVKIGYEKSPGIYNSYVEFDKHDVDGDKNIAPILVWEDINLQQREVFFDGSGASIYGGGGNVFLSSGENGSVNVLCGGDTNPDPTPSEDWKRGVISGDLLRMLKGYEGFSDHIYQDSGGVDTIGYGTTRGDKEGWNYLTSNLPCSEEQAARVAWESMNKSYGKPIVDAVIGFGCDTQQQFDALADVAYNCGPGVITGDSDLSRALKTGNEAEIRRVWEYFYTHDGAGNYLEGLHLRRLAEMDIYFLGKYEKRTISIIGGGTVSGDGWMPPKASPTSKGEEIYNTAASLNGKPYVWGGNYPPLGSDNGTDCSGLVQWAHHQNGIEISRTTYTQINEGTTMDRSNIQRGDCIYMSFSSPGVPEHVVMFDHWIDQSSGKYMTIEAKGRDYGIGHFERAWEDSNVVKRFYPLTESISEVPEGRSNFSMSTFSGAGLNVGGDISCTGNKNCIQKTKDYGFRKYYSVEDAESYLTDRCMFIQNVEETQEGTFEKKIILDDVYKQSVNSTMDYTVEIIKQGWGDYRIKEQTSDYFIVESDKKDFTFKYVITARRKGFEGERLGKVDLDERTFKKYKEKREG